MRRIAAAVFAAALAACSGEPEPAKTPEQLQQEQAEARERAKQGAVGGQVQALDNAAAVQDTVDAQAEAARAESDKQTGDAPATTPP